MKHLELLGALLACGVSFAAEPALRWSAPITVQQDAPFVTLPLPPSAYAHSLSPDLADLRVVDAAGRRVPHAWLPPQKTQSQRLETSRGTTAYALPRRAAPGASLVLPVEVQVQGDSVRVRRPGGDKAAKPDSLSPGWLFDLGTQGFGQPAPQLLRLGWSGPTEFSAAFDIDTSDDLREWRGGGSGQVMALASPSGALVQRDVPLPPDVPRFVRLVWRDTATAPRLTGAQAVSVRQNAEAQARPENLVLKPSPDSTGKRATAANALDFDLGGSLPISAVDLQLPADTRVAPVRLQGRQRSDEPWRDLGSRVFYSLDRAGAVSRSPPWGMQTTARYLRVLPDERVGALDPDGTRLALKVHPARLVFASQGKSPYRLLAGATTVVSDGALPIGTLVPEPGNELPRLGQAQLGEWAEVAEAVQQAAAADRQSALRRWLLWSVLLAGAAGLGTMVWKLAREGRGGASSN